MNKFFRDLWFSIFTERHSLLEVIMVYYVLDHLHNEKYLHAGIFFVVGVLVITIIQTCFNEKAHSLMYQLKRYGKSIDDAKKIKDKYDARR